MSKKQSLWLTIIIMLTTLPIYICFLFLLDLYDYLDVINPKNPKNVCGKISSDLINVCMAAIYLVCYWDIQGARNKFSYSRRMVYIQGY